MHLELQLKLLFARAKENQRVEIFVMCQHTIISKSYENFKFQLLPQMLHGFLF